MVSDPFADSPSFPPSQVLNDMQTDPKSGQRHMANADIRAKMQKLVSAGIVQMR